MTIDNYKVAKIYALTIERIQLLAEFYINLCEEKEVETDDTIFEALGNLEDVILDKYRTLIRNNFTKQTIDQVNTITLRNSNIEFLKNLYKYYKDLYADTFLDQEIEIEIEKEPIKLTDDERCLLKLLLSINCNYVARDNLGNLQVFTNKPYKDDSLTGSWRVKNQKLRSIAEDLPIFNHMFKFIQFKDNEPYLIKDLLKEENENERN